MIGTIITLIVIVTIGFVLKELRKDPKYAKIVENIIANLKYQGIKLARNLKQIKKDFEHSKAKRRTRKMERKREMEEQALKNLRESKRKPHCPSVDLSVLSRRTHFEPEDFDRWYKQSKHNQK